MLISIDPRAAAAGDARYNYGSSLAADRTLRYASPSSLDTADTRTEGGCLRKWYFERVEKRRPPQSAGQELGVKGHGEIEHFLRTGEDVLGTIVRRGKHMIPAPGADLAIEWAVAPPPEGFDPRPRCAHCGSTHDAVHPLGCAGAGEHLKAPTIDPARSFVHIAGVPVIGYLDLAHARGTNQGTDDILEANDPPNTIEVLDWKFLSDPQRYAKSADAVGKATPMLIYGRAYANAYEAATGRLPEHVRLSHAYFGTRKSDAFKRSRRLALPVIDERLEAVGAVMRDIADVAREERADAVPGNTRACHAFRGCPHRDYCTAGQRGSLERFFGIGTTTSKEDSNMSALTALLPGVNLGAPVSQTPPTPAAQPAPQAASPAAAPLPAPVVPPAGVGVALHLPPMTAPGFAEALQDIHDAGFGWPMFGGGGAAQAVAAVKGLVFEGQGYAGAGLLGERGVACMTVEDVLRIAAELRPYAERNRAAAQATATPPTPVPPAPVVAHPTPAGMPAILPPDAPASNPAIAALPVQPMPGDPPAAVAAMNAHAAQIATLQTANAAPIAPVTSADAPPMPVETTPAKPKRASKKAAATRKGGQTSHEEGTTHAAPTGGVVLFVDAVVDDPGADNLASYVQAWCDDVVKALGGASCIDIRCADQNSPIGFGKWKGALAAYVREQFDKGALADGMYVLDARGSEIGEVIAEALRTKVDLYVRGR